MNVCGTEVPKTWFITCLIISTILGVFLGLRARADIAEVGFETSEGFTLGNINGQNSWSGSATYVPFSVVDSSPIHSGSQAMRSESINHSLTSKANQFFNWTGENEFSFFWYRGVGGYGDNYDCRTEGDVLGIIDFNFGGNLTGGSYATILHIAKHDGLCYLWARTGTSSATPIAEFATSTWNEVKIQIINSSTDSYRVGVNGIFSEWLPNYQGDWVADNYFRAEWGSYNKCKDTIDDIKVSYYVPEAFGTDPYIEPTYPTDCSFTLDEETPTITGTATGHFTINNSDDKIWTDFDIIFEDQSTLAWSRYTTYGDWRAGDTYAWSVPYDISTSTYNVFYSLTGYDASSTNYFFLHNCEGTVYGYYPASTTLIWVDEPTYPEDEDCSSYDLLERLVCDVRNTLRSAFFPSGDKVVELKNNIGLISQKFPFNYVSATNNFFLETQNNLTSSSTPIVIGFFGATTSVNFDVLIGSETPISGLSLMELIRICFTSIIMVGLTMHFISFIKRFFK